MAEDLLKDKDVTDIGDFIVDDEKDEEILKRYLVEKISGNDMYKPDGLKQKIKEETTSNIQESIPEELDIFRDNKNNINFI